MKKPKEIKTIFISTKGLNKSIKNFPTKYMDFIKNKVVHLKVDSQLKEDICEQVNEQIKEKVD